MAEEILKQMWTRSTKECNPVKEKARKDRCLWVFKLNGSMNKHQVSLASFIYCLKERISFVWVCLVLIRSNKRGKSGKPIHHKILLVSTLGILHNLSTQKRFTAAYVTSPPHSHIRRENQSYIKRPRVCKIATFPYPRSLPLVCLLWEMQTNTRGSTLSAFCPTR